MSHHSKCLANWNENGLMISNFKSDTDCQMQSSKEHDLSQIENILSLLNQKTVAINEQALEHLLSDSSRQSKFIWHASEIHGFCIDCCLKEDIHAAA